MLHTVIACIVVVAVVIVVITYAATYAGFFANNFICSAICQLSFVLKGLGHYQSLQKRTFLNLFFFLEAKKEVSNFFPLNFINIYLGVKTNTFIEILVQNDSY